MQSCYPSYGAPTLTPVGLTPTERASLGWTHNDGNEYKAASQNFTANVRYVESRQNYGSLKWLLIAHRGHSRIIDNDPHQRQSARVVVLCPAHALVGIFEACLSTVLTSEAWNQFSECPELMKVTGDLGSRPTSNLKISGRE